MPFTPFHFGPGLLAKACAPRRFWLTSFILANILIDLEVLYYLYHGQLPLHRHLHTYLGGVAMGVAAALIMFAVIVGVSRLYDHSRRLKELKGAPLRRLFLQSLIAGLLGGISHILLDSCMHYEMHPFWPFVSGNALAGCVGVGTLHIVLAATGFFGLVIWLMNAEM